MNLFSFVLSSWTLVKFWLSGHSELRMKDTRNGRTVPIHIRELVYDRVSGVLVLAFRYIYTSCHIK